MEKLTDEAIKTFLETAPIYTWFEFLLPTDLRSDLFIDQIDLFCPICKREKPFEVQPVIGPSRRKPSIGDFAPGAKIPEMKGGVSSHEFGCMTCARTTKTIYVKREVKDKTVRLLKYGEWPRPMLDRDPLLQEFFEKDKDLYEKAVICEANGYGIGSLAYYRQIVEGHIHQLLEMIEEEAKTVGVSVELETAITELKKDAPMSAKILIANKALPDYLKPDGLNPLSKLYKTLSEGVHNGTDAECLEKARGLRDCLAYLVSELASRKKNREDFRKSIGKL